MLSSKSKSGLSEVSNNKNTAATPRASKLPRAASAKTESNSPSTLPKSRTSVDQSPRSVDSKPTTDRRSAKTSVPDKQPRTSKGPLELHAKLGAVREELKKVKEQLASTENEKTQALEELKDAKRLADEAKEKLAEALVAQKSIEERLEIEKSCDIELEQAGAEIANKRDESLEKELETLRNQHATDTAALASITEELQRLKHELAMASDEKKAALSHAEDVMKIAEVSEEKVGFLSNEVARLKTLFESRSESLNEETSEQMRKLDSEVVALRYECQRAREAEQKVVDMEALIEELQIEVSNAKRAEFDANKLAEEWKQKAELLEVRVEEVSQSELCLLDSQALLTKQVEETNASLQEALSEIIALKGKVEFLETNLDSTKADLEDSDQLLNAARQEALEMQHTLEVLKSEFQLVEEAKRQALDNEKEAASSIGSLSEERDKLRTDLEIAKEEAQKYEKAMEGFSSSLQEASREARDMQERLLMKQTEAENARAQAHESALKNIEESYQLMLDEAKYDIVCLKKAIDRAEMEAKNSKAEWDAKELDHVKAIKKLEEEITFLKEIDHEAQGANNGVQARNKLRQAESEAGVTNGVEELKAESMTLQSRLLDKENELQSISQENDDLRLREAATLEKIKELSALLAKATTKSEANGNEDTRLKENGNGVQNATDEEEDVASMEVEVKVLDAQKSVDLTSDKEPETESIDDELYYKMDGGSFDQTNGSSAENLENGSGSPTKQREQRKKKKAFLGKFGGLLKKSHNK